MSLLNQILQKQSKENGELDVNQKLDEILGFLRSDAQASEPRHFTDVQKKLLIAALSPTPNQVVNILRTTRSFELDSFADELVEIFKEAGWRVGSDDVALAGFEKGLGLGVVVHSQEEHPPSANTLVRTLMNLGFKVEPGENAHVPVNEIRVVIAPKK